MTKEKISVIVPIYNVEKYLDKCIYSIINQTYSNLEIILVDNGSSDNSGNICDKYKSVDDRIIVIHQINQGLSVARNRGIEISTGNYIGFVDSDDWIEPDMFELLYKNMMDFDADISTCDFLKTSESGEVINDIITVQNDYIKFLKEKDILHYFLLNYYNHQIIRINEMVWTKLYKRYLFDKIRFPPYKIHEDVFTTYLLLDKAQSIVMSPEYKYYYIQRSTSSMYQSTTIKIFDYFEAHLQCYEYIKLKYDELEPLGRKILLTSIVNVLFDISKNKIPVTYKEYINKMINIVEKLNIYNCGLLQDSIKILELFSKKNREWVIATKLRRT